MATYRRFIFFGYGRLVSLGPFAQVLKEIVADKEVRSAQTWFGWSWEGKAHGGGRCFCIGR
jgi:hypothetical protein